MCQSGHIDGWMNLRNSQLGIVEVPPRHSTIPKISPQQYIQGSNDMSHHAVAHHHDLLEPAEDLAHFFGREPAHVAATGDERCIETDPASAREGIEEGVSC